MAAGFALLVVALAVAPAQAQGTKRLGDFGNWSAFEFAESGKAACYMVSYPEKTVGDYKKRGDTYAVVTHRPAEERRDEVSFVAGYTHKKDSEVKITIGRKSHMLFTQGDGAWTPNAKSDKVLVKAMIKGRSMVVRGVSSRGTKTTDTYSLTGFAKAYAAINKACAL